MLSVAREARPAARSVSLTAKVTLSFFEATITLLFQLSALIHVTLWVGTPEVNSVAIATRQLRIDIKGR